MTRAVVAAVLLLAGGVAAPAERIGVIAVGDPPYGPDPELTELTHQLRAACRDRIGGVEEVSTMRARLLGQTSNATESELDRAYGGALATYQNGEFDSSVRTLRAIVDDLESLPETEESYEQWKRALLRLAHAAFTAEQDRVWQEALAKLARTEPTLQPDADQFSPSYRRRFEETKGKLRALPRRRLAVVAEGAQGTVFVNGRAMGTTPVTLTLPVGHYRIGGAAGTLRVPSFWIDLDAEDRHVVLDFALAEALRPNAGPGLALPSIHRGYGIIRAGAWMGVDRIIVASRTQEGGAQFLLGSVYDVRRGALLREGSVRMVAGSVPAVNLGALAAFLLTGQSQRDVKDRTPEVPRDVVPPIARTYEPPGVVSALPPEPASPAAAPPVVAGADRAPPPPAGATPAVVSVPAAPPPTAPPPTAKLQPLAATPAAPVPAATAAPATASASRDPKPLAKAAQKTALPPAVTAKDAAKDAAAVEGPAAAALKPSLAALSATPFPARVEPDPIAAPGRAGRAASGRGWMRPTAIGAGVLAAGFTGLAVQQALAASSAYSDADAMTTDGSTLKQGSSGARYYALVDRGDAATRNAYVSAGAAVAFAAAAGVLGWKSVGGATEPALAFHF